MFKSRIAAAVILTFGMMLAGVACSSSDGASPQPPTPSGDEKLVTYELTGMTCSACEGHVRDELGKLPNVKKVVASHKDEKAWIIVTGDAPARDDVEKAVKAAGGYKLGKES